MRRPKVDQHRLTATASQLPVADRPRGAAVLRQERAAVLRAAERRPRVAGGHPPAAADVTGQHAAQLAQQGALAFRRWRGPEAQQAQLLEQPPGRLADS